MRTPATVLALAAILACGLFPAAAQDKPAVAKPASKPGTWEKRPAMTFYLAKGAPNACGEGCSEWIVAEGRIGMNSADKLRKLLSQTGKQQLPIVFNSPGGLGREAFAIGRMLRQRGMTAIVAETIPEGCAEASKSQTPDAACEIKKQSGKKVQAELRTAFARCNSACVDAFLGAKKRMVPPGTKLGVHSARMLQVEGDKVRVAPNPDKARIATVQKMFRQYVREMGIDAKLADTVERTPFEKIHYLTRDEIISFKIDTREAQETPWMMVRLTAKPHAAKLWVETTGTTKKDFPTSLLRVYCSDTGKRYFFAYYRGLSADKTPSPQVELTSGGNRIRPKFQESAPQGWIENDRTFESYYGFMEFGFADTARKEGIELREISPDESAPRPILKLSPAGWEAAVDGLKCGSTT